MTIACDTGQSWSFAFTNGHFQTAAIKGIEANIVGAGDENRTRVLSFGI
jgi:hypothetical protein